MWIFAAQEGRDQDRQATETQLEQRTLRLGGCHTTMADEITNYPARALRALGLLGKPLYKKSAVQTEIRRKGGVENPFQMECGSSSVNINHY